MAEYVRSNQMVTEHQKQKATYAYRLWHSRILSIYGEKLLKDAVLFANISRKDIEVIFHCRRSLLFHNNEPWIKKDNNGDFDVTMRSYDGPEVFELAGLFMLNMLSKKFDKDNIGLYRDDGLSVFKNYNGHQNYKVRKKMTDLFK